MYNLTLDETCTVEPQFQEPRYNKGHGLMNNIPYPINSKVCVKGSRYNETLLLQTHFASPLVLCYIEGVWLITSHCT